MFNASQFTTVRTVHGFRFVAEISDFQCNPPLSFRMKSDKTGVEVTFIFKDTKTDREGEILGWNYSIYCLDTLRVPQLKGATATLWND